MPFIPSQANSYNVPSVVSKTVVLPPDQYSAAQFFYPPQLVGYSRGYCPARAERLAVPGGPRASRKLHMSGSKGSLINSKIGGGPGPGGANGSADANGRQYYPSPEKTTKILIPAGQDVQQNQYRDIYDDAIIPKYTPVPIGKVFRHQMVLTHGNRSRLGKKIKKMGRGSVSKRTAGMGYKKSKRSKRSKRSRGGKKRMTKKSGGAIFLPSDSVREPTKGTFIPVPY